MVKDLIVKPIEPKIANAIVKKYHYSGTICKTSQVHFGVFRKGVLVGALQFGGSIDKRRMSMSLGVGMNELLELNRMAISDVCGKNTESRVLGICLRILKKQYPFLRCIVSFADACQCGDGTVYRAANFKLHSYKKNISLLNLSPKALEYFKTLDPKAKNPVPIKSLDNKCIKNKAEFGYKKKIYNYGVSPINGYQMKYIYYYDKELETTHSSIPFDKIPDEVKMYKGKKRVEHESNASTNQVGEGGAVPTSTLHSKEKDANLNKRNYGSQV